MCLSMEDEGKDGEGFKLVTDSKRPNRISRAAPKKMLMGLNTENEYEKIEVDAVMDSGAFDTVCSLELVGGNEIKDTELSK